MGTSAANERAIRAWLRLEAARSAYSQDMKARFGLTGLEIGVLRIIAEQPSQKMRELRRSLSLHPASLGQAVDRLVGRGLCTRDADPEDARGRIVSVTEAGHRLLKEAPLAGPARLRAARISPERLEALAVAFDDALELFGLAPWGAEPPGKNSR